MKNLILSAAMILTFGAKAYAEPVKIGDPSKGTTIVDVKGDKGETVKITTSGILADDGEKANDETAQVDLATGTAEVKKKDHKITIEGKGFFNAAEDVLVPLFFFLFMIAVILGKRYFESRNEQRRLEVLRAMVDKGQPVPADVMNQLLTPQSKPEDDEAKQQYKRVRNAYGFTLAGALLILHAIITHNLSSEAEMIPGLVFLCLGVGGMMGLYLPKRKPETKIG